MGDVNRDRRELLLLLDETRRELLAHGDAWRSRQGLLRALLRSTSHSGGANATRIPSRGFYDRLLRRLLTAVRMSVSREELLDVVFSALEDGGETDGRAQRAAAYVLLIEGYRATDREELIDARVATMIGAPPARQRNLEEGFAARWRDSVFIRNLLLSRAGLDFVHSDYVETSVYSGEFRELHGKAPVWLCATSLPATAEGQAERALVALYDARHDNFDLPRGAAQEWSLLEAVGDIHMMLHHQLASTAELVADERRRLLADLAPNAIFHEVGSGSGLITSS